MAFGTQRVLSSDALWSRGVNSSHLSCAVIAALRTQKLQGFSGRRPCRWGEWLTRGLRHACLSSLRMSHFCFCIISTLILKWRDGVGSCLFNVVITMGQTTPSFVFVFFGAYWNKLKLVKDSTNPEIHRKINSQNTGSRNSDWFLRYRF